MALVVLKFGGASVSSTASFNHISNIITQKLKEFNQVICVVSAMGKMTDKLLNLAKKVHPSPPQRECDMLISVGERISVSLLAMSLDRKGIKAVSFTGSQSGIITTNDHMGAKIINIKPHRLKNELLLNKVLIVAGFQGVSNEGQITTLGRGGSDTTAVAIASCLKACHVEFYKDVKGIYSLDPKKHTKAKLYHELTYDEALTVVRHGHPILHPRCLEMGKKNGLKLKIMSYQSALIKGQQGTIIEGLTKIKKDPIYEESEF